MRFAATLAAAALSAVLLAALPGAAAAQAPVAWGTFTPGAPENRATMEAFNARVGRRATIWHTYKNFDQEPFPTITVGTPYEVGGMPLITWEPFNRNIRALARGDYDGYIRAGARQAVAFGRPILLRFAHEMNGDWYPWSVGVNGNSGADYIAAYRHVVRVFRNEGATNVKHVWAPNVGSFDNAWPGNDYVDYLGLDGYNWGAKYNNWQSFEQVFDSSYRAITRLSRKPILITEFAANERGGDKAAWVRHALSADVARRYPQIRALIWFDENKEADWRVNSSDSTLSAFRSALRSSLFDIDGNGLLAAVGDVPAPPATSPPPPPADHPPAADPDPDPLGTSTLRCGVFPRGTLRMSRQWTINVPIRCDRASDAGCYGLVKVKHVGSRRTLGTARVELWAGRRTPVRIGLPGWARTSLGRRTSVATRVSLRASGCRAGAARRVTVRR